MIKQTFILGAILALRLTAHGTVFVLSDGTDGYTGTDDTYLLRDYNDAIPRGSEAGMSQGIVSGVTVGWSILRFDLKSLALPTGLTVTSASLTLTGTSTPGAGTYNLYPICASNADWEESQCTRTMRKTGGSWLNSAGASLAGFNVSPYPYDTNTLMGSFSLTGAEGGGTKKTITFTAAGVAAIRNWINNPSQNAGFAVIESAAGNPQWTIASSENGTSAYRPILVIQVEDQSSHGVPVSWLQSYGISSNYAVAELLDPDGDGALTWEEYYAGTVPTNKESVFRVISINQTTNLFITWYATTNSGVLWPFNILMNTNMMDTNWFTLSGNIASSGYGTNVWIGPTPSNNVLAFYRVALQMDTNPPPPSEALPAPTALSVIGVEKKALLAWKAPATGVASLTDYRVEYKAASLSQWLPYSEAVSTSTKTTVTGLENGVSYDFRVSAMSATVTSAPSAVATASPRAISTLVFVFNGESNSGGMGVNADATPVELAARSCVQIMNLTNGLFNFENLQLGVNNLRDHAGMESVYNICHGFENQLANSVESAVFANQSRVFLIKTGQGGSKIADWAIGNTYWTKFLQRINAGKPQLPADQQWVVWFSLGINDAMSGTPVSTWKADTLAHLNRIKTELPGAIIVMTQFQSIVYGAAYNQTIAELAAEEAGVFAVDSTGATLGDSYHWNYAGLKTVGERMAATTKQALGL